MDTAWNQISPEQSNILLEAVRDSMTEAKEEGPRKVQAHKGKTILYGQLAKEIFENINDTKIQDSPVRQRIKKTSANPSTAKKRTVLTAFEESQEEETKEMQKRLGERNAIRLKELELESGRQALELERQKAKTRKMELKAEEVRMKAEESKEQRKLLKMMVLHNRASQGMSNMGDNGSASDDSAHVFNDGSNWDRYLPT
ncbi:hypothetical protein BDP27DRAFT_1371658 [Rhodocollybia butyracea]|uniref:Uncharacterized protein n=1 Tax=Rhodocollybia butyracea TaxID=206335 RepID=A0A9P5TXA5_9AGAR|nr:hypothetical protein BDP27DRAFT_1371658 [Rhodocollybia butyracea]